MCVCVCVCVCVCACVHARTCDVGAHAHACGGQELSTLRLNLLHLSSEKKSFFFSPLVFPDEWQDSIVK
jgi:hypothetical protein